MNVDRCNWVPYRCAPPLFDEAWIDQARPEFIPMQDSKYSMRQAILRYPNGYLLCSMNCALHNQAACWIYWHEGDP